MLFPRAKKEVWVRRRVVRVTAVGERSMRAGGVRWVNWKGWDGLLKKKNCRRNRR